ncbi:MAG: cyclic nucleotide-binding domain-containing protein [Candidatus Tectomicrobia bacterium]|uniref:Cyclic nucleotide-binding domain-containing protein n=1 Tax=Tectimicrobiota bacterium TaxID=2528274 RepID=A0A933LPV8_UNCTE|nr:cyclic nucleotide-binding domain-containing protein [Candidatus Tectomicrobia bacterium]
MLFWKKSSEDKDKTLTPKEIAKEKERLQKEINNAVKKSKWDKAVEEYRKWLKLEPNDMRLHLRLGDLLIKIEKKSEAIEEYSLVANTYAKDGMLVKAIAVNKMIARLNPSQHDTHKKLAELYKQRGLVAEFQAPPGVEGAVFTRGTPIPLFSDLNPDEFQKVVDKMKVHRLAPHSVIIKEGEKGDSLFVISSGKVEVYAREKDNKQVLLAALGEDEFFGEISALTGHPRTATIITREESEILELSKSDLDEITKDFPGVKKILEDFLESRMKQRDQQLQARKK